MGRVSKRALVKRMDPDSPIWKTKGQLLWGEYAGTAAQDLATTWFVLWRKRQFLLHALMDLARSERLGRSMLALKKHLETWFLGVEEFEWEHEREERFPGPAELKIRATAVELLQQVRNAEETLIATVRSGIMEGTPQLFRQLAEVIDLYKSLSRPPFAVDPVRFAIIEISQRQRAALDAMHGEPSSGLNGPPPKELPLDIIALQHHVTQVTGLTVAASQLRRMCKELGVHPKPGKRGRPRKLR